MLGLPATDCGGGGGWGCGIPCGGGAGPNCGGGGPYVDIPLKKTAHIKINVIFLESLFTMIGWKVSETVSSSGNWIK